MSQVIVIDSSDDEKPPEDNKIENSKKGKSKHNIERIFEEFCALCRVAMSDEDKGFLQHLVDRHNTFLNSLRTSRSYRKVIQRCIRKVKGGDKRIFVFINDIDFHLEQNVNQKRNSIDSSDLLPPPKKCKISTDQVAEPSSSTLPESSGTDETQKAELQEESEVTSDPSDKPSTSSVSSEKQIDVSRQIKALERHLKSLSKEIIRLQSTELSLDDLKREDTSYIQESKLKDKFMRVYRKICDLKNCELRTGRVKEKKIIVSASLFPEINKKVEHFVNNPKRGFFPPDFEDIITLTREASTKNQLALNESQIKKHAQSVFDEVCKKMQNRRHKDFVFEFGCSLIDDTDVTVDPASSDQSLQEKLKCNRAIAVNGLESVISKYVMMEQELQKKGPEETPLPEDQQSNDEDSYGKVSEDDDDG